MSLLYLYDIYLFIYLYLFFFPFFNLIVSYKAIKVMVIQDV